MTEEICPQCGFMTSNSLLFGLHQQYVHGKQKQNTSSPVVENCNTVPTVSGAQRQARTDIVRRLKVKTASHRYASAAVDAAKSQLGNATVRCTGKREMKADSDGRRKATNDKRKCPECPYFAPSSTRLKIHLAFHRPNSNGYKCGKCDYWGTRISDTTRHQHIHHPNYSLKFKCGKCEYWGTDVARHQLVVHPNYDLKCRKSLEMVSESVKPRVKKANLDSSYQKAGSRPRTTTARRQRRTRKRKPKKNAGDVEGINTAEGNRRQCPVCPYIGYSMERLERHKFFHQPNPNGYKCGKCDYWGHRVAATTRHQLVHQPNYGLKNQDKSLTMVSKSAKRKLANANPVSSFRMALSSTRATSASQH